MLKYHGFMDFVRRGLSDPPDCCVLGGGGGMAVSVWVSLAMVSSLLVVFLSVLPSACPRLTIKCCEDDSLECAPVLGLAVIIGTASWHFLYPRASAIVLFVVTPIDLLLGGAIARAREHCIASHQVMMELVTT